MKATIALALLILSSIDISMAVETEILSINEGEPFALKCATNRHYPVVWYFQQTHRPQEIFLGGEVSMPFQTMFRLTGNQSLGEYNLNITSVDGRYVGNYRCIDDEGLGSELRSIQIVIIASTSAAAFGEKTSAAANHEAIIAAARNYQNDEHSNSIRPTNPAAEFGIVMAGIIVAAIPVIIIIIVAKRRRVKEHAPKSDAVYPVQGKSFDQESEQEERRSRQLSSTSEKSNSSTTPLVHHV